MRPLRGLLVRLYPPSWRRRYGSELEALLEDVQPGPRELFDVLKGALAMQLETAGMIPVVCALVGAIGGGIVAIGTPKVFASSVTMRVSSADARDPAAAAELIRSSLDKALRDSDSTRATTTVMLHRAGSTQARLKLTYQDRDPEQAQRVARVLTDAIARDHRGRVEVLDAPSLPTAPIAPDYSTTIASGGGLGLVAGGLALLFVRSRKRPASAG